MFKLRVQPKSITFPKMESIAEGNGELGLGITEIETSAEGLGSSEIFHVVKEVIGFVLYMHHQIPSILQHLEDEFSSLKEEYQCLESISTPAESRASFKRSHNTRKREVKMGIKKLEKLMNDISSLLSALQQALDVTPDIQGVTLVLGASPARPQHVYEISLPRGIVDSEAAKDCKRSRVAEALSRKVVPFRLRIKCKTPILGLGDLNHTSELSHSTCLSDSTTDDVIWFQCRHTIKGLPSKSAVTEC